MKQWVLGSAVCNEPEHLLDLGHGVVGGPLLSDDHLLVGAAGQERAGAAGLRGPMHQAPWAAVVVEEPEENAADQAHGSSNENQKRRVNSIRSFDLHHIVLKLCVCEVKEGEDSSTYTEID